VKDDEKKIMGIEDIVGEGKEEPFEKEEVIVHFTFPKGSFERAKRNFERMSREVLKETVKNSPLAHSLPEQMKERMVDNLKSAEEQKLAIISLAIASVQSIHNWVTMDIYEKKDKGDGK